MVSTRGRSLRVFLAHSRHDKDFARELYYLLNADGFDPWLDEQSLLPGQDWEYEIRKAVKDTDTVAILLSERSVDGAGYLHKEVALTLDIAQQQPEGSIFLIPIRLGECPIPERVEHLHWLAADPTDVPIGRTYLFLQRSLLHRALQLGILQASELPAERRRGAGKSSRIGQETDWALDGPKGGRGTKGGFLESYRVVLLGIEGKYLVRGANPDGTKYYGTAEIVGSSDSLTLTANIGPHVLTYNGTFDGSTAAFSGAHEVAYSVERGGTLLGKWGGEAQEELIPASPFVQPRIVRGGS